MVRWGLVKILSMFKKFLNVSTAIRGASGSSFAAQSTATKSIVAMATAFALILSGCGKTKGQIRSLIGLAPTFTLTLDQTQLTFSEGSAAIINAVLSDRRDKDTVIQLALNGQNGAIATNDFTAVPSSITIPAGQLSKRITLTSIQNAVYDRNRQYQLVLTTTDSEIAVDPGTLDIILQDDDAAPVFSFHAATSMKNENAGTTLIQVDSTIAASVDVQIPITLSGTATEGSDFSSFTHSVTIPAGQTSANIPVTIIDDALSEPTEHLILTLGTPSLGSIGSTSSHDLSILDNETPVPQLSIANISVSEDAGTATLTVSLDTAPTTSPVTFNWATRNGTASAGQDYAAVSSTPVTINVGSTSTTLTVSLIGDSLHEGTENFYVDLSSLSGAILAAGSSATVTLTDNDPAPTVEWSLASQTVSESVGTVTLTANLSAASGLATTANITFTGTATRAASADYTSSAATISIPAGSTSGSVTLTINDDAIYEGNETIIATLSSPTNATLGSTTAQTVTINDNETLPALSIANTTVNENAGTATLTVTMDHASASTVTVDYSTSDETATAPADYTATSGTLSFTAGQTSKTFTVPIINDSLYEANETFTAFLASPSGATITTATATVTINDNDTAPTLQWTVVSQTASESVGTITLTAQLSAASGRDVSANVVFTGTATGSGTDYTTSASSIAISAGQTSASITLNVVDDTITESNETIIATLGTLTNATLGANAAQTVTITDNDAAPTLSINDVTVSEAAGSATLTVALSNASASTVTVNYATQDGTATAPADYTSTSGTLSFTPGQTSKTITVTIIDDTLYEVSQNFAVNLSSPSNATLATSSATVSITDNDTAPSIEWSSTSSTTSEGSTSVTLTAQLSAASGSTTSVNVGYSGSAAKSPTANARYSTASNTISIAAGQTTASYTVTLVDDSVFEGSQDAVFTLSSPTNATLGANTAYTLTITDNETQPTLAISDVTVNENAGTASLTVSLSGSSSDSITVDYATQDATAVAPGDYTAASGTLTFTAGQTSKTVTVAIVDDAVYENTETLNVVLSNPTNATISDSTGVITINDNDTQPTIQWSATSSSAAETAGSVTLTAQLSAASGLATSVTVGYSGTAAKSPTANARYSTASNTITIAAGQTSASYTVTLVDDSTYEGTQTGIFTMSSPSGATLGTNTAYTLSITDDESVPTVQWASTSSSVSETAGSTTLTAQLSNATNTDVTVNVATSGSAAKSPASYNRYAFAATSITIPAGQTSATATVTLTDDSTYEGTQDANFTLSSPSGATLGANTAYALTITDNEIAPTIEWNASSSTVSEGVASVTLTAQLSAASGLATSVTVGYSGSAAKSPTANARYSTASNTISIAAGQTTASYTVTLVDDSVFEGSQDAVFTLSSPTNATLGANTAYTLTITDNETQPTLAISDVTVNENAGTASLTVSLSGSSSDSITVDYATQDATAVAPGDYTAASGTLTFTAGQTSKTVTVAIVDDAVYENTETLNVVLSNPTNATISDSTGVITINDNDTQPTIQWSATSSSAAETAGSVTLTAQLSAASGLATSVTVGYSGTAAKSPTANARYSTASNTITIAAGQTSASYTVTLVDDSTYEGTQTGIFTMSSPSGATLGTNTAYTLSITDDESVPTIQWSATSSSAAETAGSVTLTAQLSAVSGTDVSVTVGYSGSAAKSPTANARYSTASDTVTITAGQTSATYTVTLIDDSTYEGTQTGIFTMSSPSGATLGANSAYTLSITDDETAPSISISDTTVNENAGTASLTVSLSNSSASSVTVDWASANGTATAPADYTSASGALTFTSGQTSKTVTITINDDALNEADETLTVGLSNATNATIADNSGIITITDNDPIPTIQFTQSTQSVAEDVGTVTLTAQLSAASGRDISVPVAYSGTATGSGTDYTASSGTLSITAGQTTGTVTLTIVDDLIYETNETVIATMGTPVNATLDTTSVQTVTITNNDSQPSITIDDLTVGESDGNAVVTVHLSNPSYQSITVDWATANGSAVSATDYTAGSGTLTFTAGQTSKTITVAITGDSVHEATEAFYLNLSNATNATIADNSGVVTITDDDTAPTVNFSLASQSVSESAGTATITATLSAAGGEDATIPLTITGTATGGGTDYSLSASSITIAAGQTSGSITVTIVDDTAVESNETVIATMSSTGLVGAIIGSTNVHTLTINDNDTPPVKTVTFASNSYSVDEGSSVNLVVQIDSAASEDLTFSISQTSGSAVSADFSSTPDSTVTITAGQTSANLNIAAATDALVEGSETAVFTISASSAAVTANKATIGATSSTTLTINDLTSVTITSTGTTYPTEGCAAYIGFTLSPAPTNDTSFTWTITGGTAVSGTNFPSSSGTALYSASSQKGLIKIPTTAAGLASGSSKTVTIQLGSATNFQTFSILPSVDATGHVAGLATSSTDYIRLTSDGCNAIVNDNQNVAGLLMLNPYDAGGHYVSLASASAGYQLFNSSNKLLAVESGPLTLYDFSQTSPTIKSIGSAATEPVADLQILDDDSKILFESTVSNRIALKRTSNDLSTTPVTLSDSIPSGGCAYLPRENSGDQYQYFNGIKVTSVNQVNNGVSPDRTKVIYHAPRDSGSSSDSDLFISTINTASPNPLRLNLNPISSTSLVVYKAAFTPDSTKVVYSSNDTESGWRLYSINVDGTGRVLLAADLASSSTFGVLPKAWSISPDGVWVYYVGMQGNGDYEIHKTRVDGSTNSSTTLIKAGISNNSLGANSPGVYLEVSPNGQRLIYMGPYSNGSSAPASIVIMDPDGSNINQVYTNSTYSEYAFVYPQYSPDGTGMVVEFCPTSGGTLTTSGINLYLNLTNRTSTQLSGTGQYVWSRFNSDGTKIFTQVVNTGDATFALYVQTPAGVVSKTINGNCPLASWRTFDIDWTRNRILYFDRPGGNNIVSIDSF